MKATLPRENKDYCVLSEPLVIRLVVKFELMLTTNLVYHALRKNRISEHIASDVLKWIISMKV